MRCMKKIENEKAVETLSIIKLVSSESYNEEDRNRHPEGAEDGKGGQFAPKDGGSGHSISKPKRINEEELDEDSDYRKDNPVKEDNVIHMGDPVDEEWYDKLETGEEYTQLSHIKDFFPSEYKQNFDGYNLFNRFDIKKKSEDIADKNIGQVVKLYNDDGKLIAEQTSNPMTGDFITSEKQIDENGEMKEIEYTSEEHQKNMRNFVGMDKNYNDMTVSWDKIQKERLKLKEVKDLSYYTKDLKVRQEQINREMYKADGDTPELDKELTKVMEEIENIELGEKHDDISPLYRVNMDKIDNQVDRWNRNFNDYKHKITDKEYREVAGKLVGKEKKIWDKFLRVENKLKDGMENGSIQSTNIKGHVKISTTLSYNDNQVRNNLDIMKMELKSNESKLDEAEAGMILRSDEKKYGYSEEDGIYDIERDIKEQYGIDENSLKYYQDNLDNAKIGTPEFDIAVMDKLNYQNKSKKDIPPRVKKLLDSVEKYTEVNGKGNYKFNKNQLAMFKARVGNEVITPMVEKNIHTYSIGDKEKSKEWRGVIQKALDYGERSPSKPKGYTKEEMKKWNDILDTYEVSQETLDYAYKTAKDTFSKNTWVRTAINNRGKNYDGNGWSEDIERKMHVQLVAGNGYDFKVNGKKFTAGADWSKHNETINIFQASKNSIDWSWNHELSHAQFDNIGLYTGNLKSKKKSLERWRILNTKLDPKILKPILGDYATKYVQDYIKDPTTYYANRMYTEVFAGITDLKFGSNTGDYNNDIEGGYELLNKHYPELVKVYETLKGTEQYNTYESIMESLK